MVLKRMKRRHSRADALNFVEKVRNLRPDIVFGADIIAGFPTETDEMFENTLNLVRETRLTYLHIFPYSARTGTPAARMPQVPKDIRKARAAALRAEGEIQLRDYLTSQIGTTATIVMEKDTIGRSEHFAVTKLDHALEPGSIARARITHSDGQFLYGQHIQELAA
jgi:threonylcarbamoyladenosine tRNA methylthiotransferase MtaB